MGTDSHGDGGADGDEVLNPYLDAADRLERAIDVQIDIINEIDDKSEHVTRLLGILLGLVFSVLSLGSNINQLTFESPTLATEIAFFLGIFSLLLAMAAGIVTYLSSRFRIGLHPNVGRYLAHPDAETDFDEHIRRVLGSYGDVIQQNKKVIEVNSRRFRRTLYLLLTGVLFLSTAGSLHIGQFSKDASWVGLAGQSPWQLLPGGTYLEVIT